MKTQVLTQILYLLFMGLLLFDNKGVSKRGI